jgi:hypothetical protein
MVSKYKLTQKVYYFIMTLTWISYITALTGVMFFNPVYIDILSTLPQTFVALFLLIRFNPFNTITITGFDKQIAWSGGLFILLTSAVTTAFKSHYF